MLYFDLGSQLKILLQPHVSDLEGHRECKCEAKDISTLTLWNYVIYLKWCQRTLVYRCQTLAGGCLNWCMHVCVFMWNCHLPSRVSVATGCSDGFVAIGCTLKLPEKIRYRPFRISGVTWSQEQTHPMLHKTNNQDWMTANVVRFYIALQKVSAATT